jgi:hypothetical protein
MIRMPFNNQTSSIQGIPYPLAICWEAACIEPQCSHVLNIYLFMLGRIDNLFVQWNLSKPNPELTENLSKPDRLYSPIY